MNPFRIFVPLLLILCTTVPAADWPGWRGTQRDGHVELGIPVPEKLPAAPKVIWRIPTGDGFASPVVSGEKVALLDFVDGKEVVRLLDAADGKELWKTPLDDPHKDNFGTGPRCAPLIDSGKVYAQSCRGELKCLNLADGKLLWRTNYGTDFGQLFIGEKGQAAGACRHGNAGSPLVDGEQLIALAGAKGASVVAFAKADGKVLWKSQDDTTAYAPPVILTLAGERQVVVFTSIALIGLNPKDGALLWRVPLKTSLGRHVATPVASGDLVLVASHQIGLVAIKVSRDASTWKAEQAYQIKEAQINFSSPVLVDGYLYGVGSAGKYICVEAATGKITWDQNGILKSPDRAYAAFIVMGKNILSLTDSGELILFAADPAKFTEISRVKVCDLNWCSPAYVDGRLYVRDKHELLCLDILH